MFVSFFSTVWKLCYRSNVTASQDPAKAGRVAIMLQASKPEKSLPWSWEISIKLYGQASLDDFEQDILSGTAGFRF